MLARGAPHSRIFVVSQWGSPTTYWKALRPAQRQQFVAGDQGGGTGPVSNTGPALSDLSTATLAIELLAQPLESISSLCCRTSR